MLDGDAASLDVITTRNFSARLLETVLWVASIGKGDIRRCAWPLIRAMLFRHDERDAEDEERAPYEDEDSGFFSLTHDEDGLSLVMDDTCKAAFDDFSGVAQIVYAPCRWRAFQIHLGTSAMPGCVRGSTRARERPAARAMAGARHGAARVKGPFVRRCAGPRAPPLCWAELT